MKHKQHKPITVLVDEHNTLELDRITFHQRERKGTGEPYMEAVFYRDGKRTFKAVPVEITRTDEDAAYKWLKSSYSRSEVIKQASEPIKLVIRPLDGVKPIGARLITRLITFAQFAKQWTDGELYKERPDFVTKKDATEDESALRLYINPILGDRLLSNITLDDCEEVMAKLPTDLAPRTRKRIAQCLSKLFMYAVYPFKHIALSPLRNGFTHIQTTDKAKSFLYPKEDAKLLACPDIPIERRIAYGILSREGFRTGELEALRWNDLDLDLGRVRLDTNKTKRPRAWALSKDVVRVLTWWKKQRQCGDRDLVLGIDLAEASKWFRGTVKDYDGKKAKPGGDLAKAGITRAELWESTASRQPIRVHDLRATFVTLSLANGKSIDWVCARTGHCLSMVEHYRRGAQEWGDLELGEMKEMDKLLPEMKKSRKKAA